MKTKMKKLRDMDNTMRRTNIFNKENKENFQKAI